VSQPHPERYRLPESESERIFAERIVPQLLAGGDCTTNPLAFHRFARCRYARRCSSNSASQ
jgi:hypothetical protein